MSKSKLQVISQQRNSFKGRVKGLRNNIRGMVHNTEALHLNETERLTTMERDLDNMLLSWDTRWEQIKEDLDI
jgi:hypothetical protein